jgi:hypothetical protein
MQINTTSFSVPFLLRHSLTLSLLLGFATGCAHQKAPFMLGVYSVSKNQLSTVAAEGFDLVASPANREYLREANQYGVKVLAPSGAMKPISAQSRGKIITMDREPALWAWYLVDEPDLHRIPPATVSTANRNLKSIVNKPTLVVLSSGSAVEKYAHCADLLAVDWYPVPWAPVSTFAREMRLARLGAHGKPFYSIIQAFNWAAFPEMVKTDKALREPTCAEVRCMAYLAIANDARGLLFYTYSEPNWTLKEHSELWVCVENLATELRELAPLFAHRVPWFPLETNHHGAEMFNEIYEARVLVNLFKVPEGTEAVAPGCYFLCINTTAEPLEYSFKIPFPTEEKRISVLNSSDSLKIVEGWVNLSLNGFETTLVGPVHPTKVPHWLEAPRRSR